MPVFPASICIMEAKMSYIEFKNVVKEYISGETKIRALDEASFFVKEGELAVILGSSGAGKPLR